MPQGLDSYLDHHRKERVELLKNLQIANIPGVQNKKTMESLRKEGFVNHFPLCLGIPDGMRKLCQWQKQCRLL